MKDETSQRSTKWPDKYDGYGMNQLKIELDVLVTNRDYRKTYGGSEREI